MKIRLTALTLLSTALIMPAMIPGAAQAGGHTVDKFMQADADGNALVSKEEYLARKEAGFMDMDANSDGSVSAEEYETWIHAKMDKYKKDKHMKGDHSDDHGHDHDRDDED